MPLPTACIIGAGSSGIAAAKALPSAAFAFDCFEKSDRVGGNWVFGNTQRDVVGLPLAAHQHLARAHGVLGLPDAEVLSRLPAPHPHRALLRRLRRPLRLPRPHHASRPASSTPRARADGVWEVTLDDGETRRYDALLVANGHHWDPRWPEPAFPGADGSTACRCTRTTTSDDEPTSRGKNVVVLGMGNSAMDIAVEVGQVAERTFLAARRGACIIPKYLFGKPLDQIGDDAARSRSRVRQQIFAGACCARGRATWSATACPSPTTGCGEAHPTISDDILARIAHGEITPKPNIAALEGDGVRFADGSVEQADVVVYCTGYKVTFPFFDEELHLGARQRPAAVPPRVPPGRSTTCSSSPCSSRWGRPCRSPRPRASGSRDYLRGRVRAAAAAGELRRDIERERQRMFKRYVASKRHTMQVDFDDYLHALGREQAAGRGAGPARRVPLPVPPRAGVPADAAVTA